MLVTTTHARFFPFLSCNLTRSGRSLISRDCLSGYHTIHTAVEMKPSILNLRPDLEFEVQVSLAFDDHKPLTQMLMHRLQVQHKHTQKPCGRTSLVPVPVLRAVVVAENEYSWHSCSISTTMEFLSSAWSIVVPCS